MDSLAAKGCYIRSYILLERSITYVVSGQFLIDFILMTCLSPAMERKPIRFSSLWAILAHEI